MEKEPVISEIYAEINRKRALLGITIQDFSTYKRHKPTKHVDREIIISPSGGWAFKK